MNKSPSTAQAMLIGIEVDESMPACGHALNVTLSRGPLCGSYGRLFEPEGHLSMSNGHINGYQQRGSRPSWSPT